ncbi:major capsid protein [Streptomyces phage Araceli]|nr:major capsid protein [Streptomyces phage Henoccus]AWY07334.1 major capsid protein [Streptomyces phage JackieB]QFG07830.1 major capsid protein [Streptomyces phage Araceli]
MAMRRITSVDDGPRLTVSQLVKSPTLVPKRIIQMTGQGFMVDQLLRQGPPIPGGSLIFSESEPLYADEGPMNVEEFGEIPLTTTSTGEMRVAKSVKKALGFRISQESIDRNNFDKVQQDMVKLKNSFAKTYEDVFLTALLAALPTFTSSNTWVNTAASAAGAGIYADLAKVTYNIGNQDADTSNGTGEQKFHFQPDTIVINDRVATLMLLNADIAKVLGVGDVAGRQPLVTGDATELFMKAFGLRLVKSWRLSPDKAIVLQSKVVGGVSDERPLGATPLYEHRPTETWRTDVTRMSAVFIDQPKAGCVITNINGGSASIANF